MIYCIGNSHVWIFTGDTTSFPPIENNKLTPFKTEYIGPTIAYNFFDHHLPKVMKILVDKVDKEKDTVMLVVGEVDCRWHLPFQANLQKRKLEDLVLECVNRFFKSILFIQQQGYKVCTWGPHPTTTREHTNDGETFIYGDVQTRNNACLLWNKYLRGLCEKHNIKFHSIYSKLVDGNNVTKMEYLRDYCHLSDEAIPFIIEEFKDYVEKND